MFAGEVLIVAVILLLARRVNDTPAEEGVKLDLFGTLLSALGLGLIVFGILKSGTWGVVQPKPEAPQWIGLSPVIWLMLGGGVVLALFLRWEGLRIGRGEGALLDPKLLRNVQMRSGVLSFLFMFLVQAGTFFVVPLFLSVALGLSAMETGVRLLPMSLTLLLFAAGVPKLAPDANPRRVVNAGFLLIFAGLVLLVSLLDIGAGPEIITGPLLLIGSGLGAMASQLGSVTVSAVPDEQSGEVGGVQNTGTQLGASIGTALAGAILISALTAAFFSGIQNNPAIPDNLAVNAQTQLATGVPFVSDKDLQKALDDAGVPPETANAVVDENAAGPDRRPALRPRRARAHQPPRAALHPRHPNRPARRRSQAERAADRGAGCRLTRHHEKREPTASSAEVRVLGPGPIPARDEQRQRQRASNHAWPCPASRRDQQSEISRGGLPQTGEVHPRGDKRQRRP